MRYFKSTLLVLLLFSCKTDPNKDSPSFSQGASWHKSLFELNHNIIEKMSRQPITAQDSAFLKLSEYVDVVVLAMIEGSGGQKAEDGSLMFPKDNSKWIGTLKEIDFKKTWELGIEKIPGLKAESKSQLKKDGLQKINLAIKEKQTLEKVCIEFRLVQLTIISYWIGNN